MNDSNDHKDHALSRIYREGAWPEPSRQIDQAILAASRRAARERSFARRWAPSFAVAATVVLTSTLVLKIYREQPDVISPSAPDKTTALAKQAPAAEQKAAADTKAGGTKAADTKPAAPPAVAPVVTPRGFTSNMDAAEAERLERAQHDLGFKGGITASESPLPAPKAAPADKAVAPGALKKASPEAARQDSLQRGADIQTPRAAPQQSPSAGARVFSSSPSAASGAPANAFAPAAAATPKAAVVPSAPPPAATPFAPPAASASPNKPSGAISSEARSANVINLDVPAAAERSPQAWIEDIRKLMAAGRSIEAGQELAEFRKRYPGYTLPEDLR